MDAQTKRKLLDTLCSEDLKELVKKRRHDFGDQSLPPPPVPRAEGPELLGHVLQQPELAQQIVLQLPENSKRQLASCNRSLLASVKHTVRKISAWNFRGPDVFSKQSLATLPSFQNLKSLYFCLNKCTAARDGWFWSSLAQVPQLNDLNLDSQRLRSLNGLKALSGLSSLQKFSVTAPLRCVSTITSLSHLTCLDLDLAFYGGRVLHLDSLMYLTGLKSLYLYLPHYQEIEATCALSSLDTLDTFVLSGAEIDCLCLAPMTRLTCLNLYDCASGCFENITALTQLVSFATGWKGRETPLELRHVTALSRLTSLGFYEDYDDGAAQQLPAAYCTALGGLRELACQLPFTECRVDSNIMWTRMTALTALTVMDLRPLDLLTSLRTLRSLTLQLVKAAFLDDPHDWSCTYLDPLVDLAITSLTIEGRWPMGLPLMPEFHSALRHLTLNTLILGMPRLEYLTHLTKLTFRQCNLATNDITRLAQLDCEVVFE